MATKYQRSLEIVDAVPWTKVGDHADITALSVSSEGGKKPCSICGQPLSAHGIRDAGGLHDTICPGKWIITREDGRIEYLDDATFQARYTALKE